MVIPLTSLCFCLVTNGRHELVPKDVREEAEKYAKVSDTCVHEHAHTYTYTHTRAADPGVCVAGLSGGGG